MEVKDERIGHVCRSQNIVRLGGGREVKDNITALQERIQVSGLNGGSSKGQDR